MMNSGKEASIPGISTTLGGSSEGRKETPTCDHLAVLEWGGRGQEANRRSCRLAPEHSHESLNTTAFWWERQRDWNMT